MRKKNRKCSMILNSVLTVILAASMGLNMVVWADEIELVDESYVANENIEVVELETAPIEEENDTPDSSIIDIPPVEETDTEEMGSEEPVEDTEFIIIPTETEVSEDEVESEPEVVILPEEPEEDTSKEIVENEEVTEETVVEIDEEKEEMSDPSPIENEQAKQEVKEEQVEEQKEPITEKVEKEEPAIKEEMPAPKQEEIKRDPNIYIMPANLVLERNADDLALYSTFSCDNNLGFDVRVKGIIVKTLNGWEYVDRSYDFYNGLAEQKLFRLTIDGQVILDNDGNFHEKDQLLPAYDTYKSRIKIEIGAFKDGISDAIFELYYVFEEVIPEEVQFVEVVEISQTATDTDLVVVPEEKAEVKETEIENEIEIETEVLPVDGNEETTESTNEDAVVVEPEETEESIVDEILPIESEPIEEPIEETEPTIEEDNTDDITIDSGPEELPIDETQTEVEDPIEMIEEIIVENE